MPTPHEHTHSPQRSSKQATDHEHTHEHTHTALSRAQEAVHRVHTAPVVMDIGEGTGSLVIYTPPEWAGLEIEISPTGDDARRVHTDVAERRVGQRAIFAAVYLPMAAGVYTLWAPAPHGPVLVTITADAITELDWRSPSAEIIP